MIQGCDHATEYIYHYLDNEITWTRQQRIRWHLRRCRDCSGAFEFEMNLKASIRRAARTDVPPELIDRLQALIQQEEQHGF